VQASTKPTHKSARDDAAKRRLGLSDKGLVLFGTVHKVQVSRTVLDWQAVNFAWLGEPGEQEVAQRLGLDGLGLAHHFVLGRWLDAGCPVAPAQAAGAPAGA
jgi:hypothetical protein